METTSYSGDSTLSNLNPGTTLGVNVNKEKNLNYSQKLKCYNIWNYFIGQWAPQRVPSLMQGHIPYINSCLRSYWELQCFICDMTIKSSFYIRISGGNFFYFSFYFIKDLFYCIVPMFCKWLHKAFVAHGSDVAHGALVYLGYR